MGTAIQLTVGGLSLDYAKNNMRNDYGFLFQEGDLSRRRSDQINYEYYAENPQEDDLAESEQCFVRPLNRVLSRIEILGHSLASARAEYEALLENEATIFDENENAAIKFAPLSFDEFCALACMYPLSDLADNYIEDDQLALGRFAKHQELFKRLPWLENSDLFWSEKSYLGAKVCLLSPFSMLQVFATNPVNATAEVIWQFGPIVNSGWVSRESFHPGAVRSQKILVATEGASDARILRRALDLLRSDVADFFRFIDGDERHHFWGTGNLVKFAEGLLRIDVQNQVLFLLDNDAEGVEAHKRLRELCFPPNMRSMRLPDIEEFRRFPARGPEGVHECDINGRAAAIECYLDLNLKDYPQAQVLWSNYKKEIDAWHGALEHKGSYVRHFMDQDDNAVTNGAYNASRLKALIDALVAEALHFAI